MVITNNQTDQAEQRAATPVRVAVEWWTDQLHEQAVHDVGNPLHSLTLAWAQHNKGPLTLDEVERFRQELYKIAIPQYERYRFLGFWVDYTACKELRGAAQAAGIDIEFRLPSKARMDVKPDGVWLYGGGHPHKRLWPHGWSLLLLPWLKRKARKERQIAERNVEEDWEFGVGEALPPPDEER